MSLEERKRIVYRLKKDEYGRLFSVAQGRGDTSGKAPEMGYSETLGTYFPEEFPAGVKSRIDIIRNRMDDGTAETDCYLGVTFADGFACRKLLSKKDFDGRSGRPKPVTDVVFNRFVVLFE